MKSPLLEDVNLQGARGVLVNITASAALRMKEYHEVMNTIKEFTAEDAMVIVGTVIDEAMGDRLRVTMVATGLGPATAKQQQRAPNIALVEPVQVRAAHRHRQRRRCDGIDQLRRSRAAGGGAARHARRPRGPRRPSMRRRSRRSCASRRINEQEQTSACRGGGASRRLAERAYPC